ncbi:hypothetical protein [Lysinibacillus parviboronicapiens]|uniref:hypothetical protein n=1 Tax=Lysinibacillus parviboronicapiens TaxID=436516 RepID=UPI00187D2091|nr:hypothetical protein [Lysinibacillus parviboronicapiens]
MNSQVSEQFVVAPRVAPIVWFVNINVVFIGNTKGFATVYKPDSGEIAMKFINSNWGW